MLTKHLVLVLTLSTASILAACGKGGGGGDKLGVPECDAYLDKMAACATKTGGTTADQLTKMRDMMASSWKESVKDDAQKTQLPATCTSAIADMKKQIPTCEW